MMENTRHNIDLALRGFKDMLDEIKDKKRAYFYIDFPGGADNERELIAALKEAAGERGLSFEVEYDDGDLVIWAGDSEYMFHTGAYDD
jgi:hypothetical protein